MTNLILYLHILGSFFLISGSVTSLIIWFIHIEKTGTLNFISISKTSSILISFGSLISLITGTILVTQLGLSHSEPWIIASYLTWFFIIILSEIILRPLNKRIQIKETKKYGKNILLGKIIVSLILFSVLVITIFMVFKPSF